MSSNIEQTAEPGKQGGLSNTTREDVKKRECPQHATEEMCSKKRKQCEEIAELREKISKVQKSIADQKAKLVENFLNVSPHPEELSFIMTKPEKISVKILLNAFDSIARRIKNAGNLGLDKGHYIFFYVLKLHCQNISTKNVNNSIKTSIDSILNTINKCFASNKTPLANICEIEAIAKANDIYEKYKLLH